MIRWAGFSQWVRGCGAAGLVALTGSLSGVAYGAQTPHIDPEVLEDAQASFIVVFHDIVTAAQVGRLAEALVNKQGGQLRFRYHRALKGFSANLAPAAAEQLARHPAVRYVERNGIAWALGEPAAGRNDHANAAARRGSTSSEPLQEIPYGIARVGGPRDGSGKHAWVIDTGIDLTHPDLNVGFGANFSRRGANTTDDGNGHGTHVAGTIAALDNGIDVVGVAANATVHPVRVLDASGSGTIDAVIAGVDYVATTAAPGDVANMSLGASGHFQALHDAVTNAASLGIRFAIAAGNSSADASSYEPAHVEHPNVYTVSAIDSLDVFAYFSNFGNPPVDFAAPGVGVLSTKDGGGVVSYSGTSMAAPHVAGLLLLGLPVADGAAHGDPDGYPDPIAHH